MKRLILLIALFAFVQNLMAHSVNYDGQLLKQWHVGTEGKTVEGSFMMFKDGKVFIEDAAGIIASLPLASLSKDDQAFVMNKVQRIRQLNEQLANANVQSHSISNPLYQVKYWGLFALILLMAIGTLVFVDRQRLKFIVPILFIGSSTVLLSFTKQMVQYTQTTTDPHFIDSAFAPFKPAVYTRWDSTYFYVESKGIPSHEMMAGITAWQQQVPIPQCYTDNNAWSIPLNPVNADTVVPVNQHHFLRGAVAIAVNGVAIFNPYTNTGADAYLTGQVDSFGGHCGRADDYHYHIAPLVLYSQTAATKPIAFALDGYAIYGATEPEGGAMRTLDVNHGHYGNNGVYHYHGTAGAPYMIGNMVGKVTEDTTLQIVPQAAAHPIRPSLTPLTGAVITACHANGNNGYTVIYTLNGNTDSVVYSWTNAGVYTFNFYQQGSAMTTQTYNGFTQCSVKLDTTHTAIQDITGDAKWFAIFPNPSSSEFNLQLQGGLQPSDVKLITVYNLSGAIIYQSNSFTNKINLPSASGTYLVKVVAKDKVSTQKILIQ